MAVPHHNPECGRCIFFAIPSIRLFETPEAASWAFQSGTAWRTPRAAAASPNFMASGRQCVDGRSAELVIENIETNVPPDAPMVRMKRY